MGFYDKFHVSLIVGICGYTTLLTANLIAEINHKVVVMRESDDLMNKQLQDHEERKKGLADMVVIKDEATVATIEQDIAQRYEQHKVQQAVAPPQRLPSDKSPFPSLFMYSLLLYLFQ